MSELRNKFPIYVDNNNNKKPLLTSTFNKIFALVLVEIWSI